MIDVWLILRAIFWQGVGAGMLAKGAVDQHNRNMTSRAKIRAYAPIKEWWEKYGTSAEEGHAFYDKYMRDREFRQMVLDDIHDHIPKDVFDRLYKNWKRGSYDTAACAYYYAIRGKAFRDERWSFPMCGRLYGDTLDVAHKLLREHGIPNAHWYCMGAPEQKQMIGLSPWDNPY